MVLPIEAYRRIQPDPVLPWPEPEVGAYAVCWGGDDGYGSKRAVADLVSFAERSGWTVLVTRAKGAWPSIGKKPGPQRWSLAVRAHRGDQRAVAVYVEGSSSWSWQTMLRWGTGHPLHEHTTLAAFKVALE